MPTTTTIGGRYLLREVLGQGGMADVWAADDRLLERRVALKLLRADDPDLAARLQREARALATLDHPNLVRLLDAGSEGGRPYVVMDLVEGPSVAAALRGGPPGEARVAALGADVAGGLGYVHRAGIVHRDVKPSNILLDGSGRARLADFGIAQLTDASDLTATGTTVGTVSYMAPEQLAGNRVGPAADVWSLGMVLLECLTGVKAYEGTPAEIVARRLSGPVALPDTLPLGWRHLLGRMLAGDPAQRPAAGEVQSLLAGGPPDAAMIAPLLDPTEAVPAGGWHDHEAAATAVLAEGDGVGATRVLPEGPMGRPVPLEPVGVPGRPAVPAARRGGRRWLPAALAAAAVALVIVLLAATHGSGTPARAASPTTTSPSTTAAPTSATSATTGAPSTTSPPTPETALALLGRDVGGAVASGALPSDVADQLLSQAQQAVVDAQGGPDGASGPLQAAAGTLAKAASTGKTSSTVATTIGNDLSALATALGLPASAATPTTTAAPAPAPAGGPHGKGGGGHGGDGG